MHLSRQEEHIKRLTQELALLEEEIKIQRKGETVKENDEQ